MVLLWILWAMSEQVCLSQERRWRPQPGVPRERRPVSDLVTDSFSRSASDTCTEGIPPYDAVDRDSMGAPAIGAVTLDRLVPISRSSDQKGCPVSMDVTDMLFHVDHSGAPAIGAVDGDRTVPISRMSMVTSDRAMMVSVSLRQAPVTDEATISKGAVTGPVTEAATSPVPSPIPAAWHAAAKSWLKPPAPNWSVPSSTMSFQGSNPLMMWCGPVFEPNHVMGFQGSDPLIQGSDRSKPADPNWRLSPSAAFQGSTLVYQHQELLVPTPASCTSAVFQGSSSMVYCIGELAFYLFSSQFEYPTHLGCKGVRRILGLSIAPEYPASTCVITQSAIDGNQANP